MLSLGIVAVKVDNFSPFLGSMRLVEENNQDPVPQQKTQWPAPGWGQRDHQGCPEFEWIRWELLYIVWFKKKWKPGFDSKFLKIEKRYNKTDYSTFIWYIVHWYSAMDGCTAINFVILFLSKLAVFALHDDICGSFHDKATIQSSALHCVLNCTNFNSTWMKTVSTCFTKMIAEQQSRPNMNDQCTIWRKKMLSSTDDNFMIFLFDFERFRIESWFPFRKLTLYSHQEPVHVHEPEVNLFCYPL